MEDVFVQIILLTTVQDLSHATTPKRKGGDKMTEEKEEKNIVVATKSKMGMTRGSAKCIECGETVYYSDDWDKADMEVDGFICRECQTEKFIEGGEFEFSISEQTVKTVNEKLGTDYTKEDLMKWAKKDIGVRGLKKILEEKEKAKGIGG